MATQQPAAYIQLEMYEGKNRFLGLASVMLPEITNVCVSINGVGLMGNMEVPVIGMLENMVLSANFLTTTDATVKLMTPVKHQLELRTVEEYWDVENAETGTWADKFVTIVRPKSIKPGTVAPMSAADTSGEFDVYYYAAYKKGRTLWEIDKRNMKFVVNGVDYMASIRKDLGL